MLTRTEAAARVQLDADYAFSSTAPGINCLVNPNGEAWRNKIFYLQLIFNSACKP